jgi:hypothetical protein
MEIPTSTRRVVGWTGLVTSALASVVGLVVGHMPADTQAALAGLMGAFGIVIPGSDLLGKSAAKSPMNLPPLPPSMASSGPSPVGRATSSDPTPSGYAPILINIITIDGLAVEKAAPCGTPSKSPSPSRYTPE